MGRLLLTGAALAVLLSLGGCGGGGVAPGAASPGGAVALAHGRVAVRVAWPRARASRVVPHSAKSMVVELWSGGTLSASQTIVAPATSAVFETYPTGSVEARVSAYATTDATGPAVATGTGTGTFTAGADGTIPVTLASRIVRIETNPSYFALAANEVADFDVYAEDADAALVPTDPADFTFVSDHPEFASVDAWGKVTKHADGDATITVTETNTGLTTDMTVITGT